MKGPSDQIYIHTYIHNKRKLKFVSSNEFEMSLHSSLKILKK